MDSTLNRQEALKKQESLSIQKTEEKEAARVKETSGLMYREQTETPQQVGDQIEASFPEVTKDLEESETFVTDAKYIAFENKLDYVKKVEEKRQTGFDDTASTEEHDLEKTALKHVMDRAVFDLLSGKKRSYEPLGGAGEDEDLPETEDLGELQNLELLMEEKLHWMF